MTKRRILATVMVLALCLGLLPVTALGEEPSPGLTPITEDMFVVNTDDATYTGEPINKDILCIYDVEGDTLVKDRDYTVAYANNTDVGRATITITGIDPYTGTLTYHFNIIEPSTNPSESPSTTPSESPEPSESPSESPSTNPSESPSADPSASPSTNPSESPSANPSESPSADPSESPSANPSESPSADPSESPSTNPSESPSTNPSESPSESPAPSTSPDPSSSPEPSENPSESPSASPSPTPSQTPDDPKPTPSESKLTLNKSSVRVQTNQTVSVTATVSGQEDRNIYAISADTSVATVSVSDKTITVRGVAVGNTSVYVIMSDVNTVTLADVIADPGVQKLEVTVTGPSASSGINYRPSGGGGGGSSAAAPPPTQTATPASALFTDVVKDSWYEPGVTYVVNKGLFKGMSEGVFSPHTNMTRAMVMTVLARMDGRDTTNAVNGPWYANILNWAVAKGITDGTMPDRSVTREQLVTMLYRYAKATAVEGDLTDFVDSGNVSPYARAAMIWAVKEGILTGKTSNRLDPQSFATRAEVATIFQRFVEARG